MLIFMNSVPNFFFTCPITFQAHHHSHYPGGRQNTKPTLIFSVEPDSSPTPSALWVGAFSCLLTAADFCLQHEWSQSCRIFFPRFPGSHVMLLSFTALSAKPNSWINYTQNQSYYSIYKEIENGDILLIGQEFPRWSQSCCVVTLADWFALVWLLRFVPWTQWLLHKPLATPAEMLEPYLSPDSAVLYPWCSHTPLLSLLSKWPPPRQQIYLVGKQEVQIT